MTRLKKLAPALLSTVLAAGCLGTSLPSRFYALAPVASHVQGAPGLPEAPVAADSEAAGRAAAQGPSVRIAVVELPRYLRGNEIVTRIGPHQLDLAPYDRWGGALADDFARVLTTNLARLLPSDRIVPHAWEQHRPFDASLYVDVRRFDAESGVVVLEALWSFTDADHALLASRLSEFSRPVQGEGYAAVVAAMSAALGDLSAELAAALHAALG